jgi:hypothetical protein
MPPCRPVALHNLLTAVRHIEAEPQPVRHERSGGIGRMASRNICESSCHLGSMPPSSSFMKLRYTPPLCRTFSGYRPLDVPGAPDEGAPRDLYGCREADDDSACQTMNGGYRMRHRELLFHRGKAAGRPFFPHGLRFLADLPRALRSDNHHAPAGVGSNRTGPAAVQSPYIIRQALRPSGGPEARHSP